MFTWHGLTCSFSPQLTVYAVDIRALLGKQQTALNSFWKSKSWRPLKMKITKPYIFLLGQTIKWTMRSYIDYNWLTSMILGVSAWLRTRIWNWVRKSVKASFISDLEPLSRPFLMCAIKENQIWSSNSSVINVIQWIHNTNLCLNQFQFNYRTNALLEIQVHLYA